MQEIKIRLKNEEIIYFLTRKNVKNINLSIRKDGKIYVSANSFVSQNIIDNFIIKKVLWIKHNIEKLAKAREIIYPPIEDLGEAKKALTEIFEETCAKYYGFFEKKFPLKIRKMKSRWGTFNSKNNIITLSYNLFFSARPCVEYVILHELCHSKFLNHGKQFYGLLDSLMPDWKFRKKVLNNQQEN